MSGETVIEVRGLRTQFGRALIHDGLDLDVLRGEVLGVVGGSGTGKSVLLRTLVGLKRPEGGEVRLFGQRLDDLPPEQRSRVERRMGVMFQDGALFSSLTVLENVMVPLKEHYALPRDLLEEAALLKLALAGLPVDAGYKFPSELSGGMRKRAGLARAIALDPDVLFLDEPTAGLDPITAAAFDELVRTLSRGLGLTVFLVTHDLDTLYTACDRVAVLADRRVVITDTLEAIEACDHPWIREYFHGPRARNARAVSGLAQASGPN